MKKILTILLLCISVNLYAEIPGFVEFDMSMNNLYGANSKHNDYFTINYKVKYSTDLKRINYYFLYEYENNFVNDDGFLSNKPFRDVYTIGIGVIFIDTFYLEFMHKCSHRVVSYSYTSENEKYWAEENLYQDMTNYSHNIIRFGAKFRID
ncbi:MAG: hypothetical protein ACFFG0_02215 [Candidatus Thorarchaeota archaeon]